MAEAVEQKHNIIPSLVVANPVPVQFWKREMLWRDNMRYGQGSYTAPSDIVVDNNVGLHQMEGARTKALAKEDMNGSAYLFWSRMPVVRVVGEGADKKMNLSDQRFGNPIVSDRFTVSVPLKGKSE